MSLEQAFGARVGAKIADLAERPITTATRPRAMVWGCGEDSHVGGSLRMTDASTSTLVVILEPDLTDRVGQNRNITVIPRSARFPALLARLEHAVALTHRVRRCAACEPASCCSESDLRAVKRAGSVDPPHLDSRGFQRPSCF